MIVIDGSFGEGGGQIFRTSISLAAITGQDVTIENIRAGREKPGLRPQHLLGALAVADICGAEVRGVEVGSSKFVFKPHQIKPGSYEFDVSRIRASAGSVNLILQTILWPLALAGKKSRVTLKGGTHVPHAPTYNYIKDTFLPTVADMGLICTYNLIRAGYYPAGGGEVRLEVRPVERFHPIQLTHREEPLHIDMISAVSNLPAHIAERQVATGANRTREMGLTTETRVLDYPSPGKGTFFFASVVGGKAHAGFQSIGELKKRAEKVADEACDELEAYIKSGMATEKHLADQLIIPMALAAGESKLTTSEITRHLLTNIQIVQRFLPAKFEVQGELGSLGTVSCSS